MVAAVSMAFVVIRGCFCNHCTLPFTEEVFEWGVLESFLGSWLVLLVPRHGGALGLHTLFVPFHRPFIAGGVRGPGGWGWGAGTGPPCAHKRSAWSAACLGTNKGFGPGTGCGPSAAESWAGVGSGETMAALLGRSGCLNQNCSSFRACLPAGTSAPF